MSFSLQKVHTFIPMNLRNSALIIFSILYSVGIVRAQISITNVDMPAIDTVYHFHNASILNVDFDFTGGDVVWDYTSLVQTGFSQDSFHNPASTPFVYQLVFNNFLYPAYDATHAHPASGIVLPSQIPFEVTDVYNYYKNTSSSFSILGFGATINGIPTPIQYQGKDRIYKFPVSFGNMDTSSYSFEVNVPTLGYWNRFATRYNHVDGYGVLMLPDGYSYDVLRMKSIIEMTDTLFIESLGFPIPLPRIQTEYKFIAPGEGEPLLQITTQPLFLFAGQEVVTSVKYKNELNYATINNAEAEVTRIYPNPSSDFIQIDIGAEDVSAAVIFDSKGKVCQMLKGNHKKIDINNLSSGTYYVVITSDSDKRYVSRLIKK